MHPHLTRVLRRARRELDRFDLADPGTHDTPSPYRFWHGPPPTTSVNTPSEPAVSVVGDIASIQGVAPPDAPLVVEFAPGTDDAPTHTIDITHRFAHPDAPPGGPAVGYEVTVDAADISEATRLRVSIDGHAGSWIDAPRLPSPGGMPGTEPIDACPACGGSDLQPAGRRQQLTMATCGGCGLVMTTPRPVEQNTLMRYSERYFAEEYLPSQTLTPALARHIDSILAHAEPARALCPALFELGVGGGNLLDRARARGWTTSGTDVNEAAVRHGNQRGLDVRLDNADHANDLGGRYGAIVSEMSLEHVRRPAHFCRLAADALVPGGRLVIYTVSAEGASVVESGMASPLIGPAEHLFLFSAGSLVALCEQAGLRVDTLWRNPAGDEIGIVATARADHGNRLVARTR